jgi:uncharacterized membrane protein YvbJ
MALTTCEECGRAISDRALSCPQCGMPRDPTATEPRTSTLAEHPRDLPPPDRQRVKLVAGVSIAAVFILIVVVVLAAGPPSATKTPANNGAGMREPAAATTSNPDQRPAIR